MSTKIYEAYKFPTKHLNALLVELQDQAINKTAEYLDTWSKTSKGYTEFCEGFGDLAGNKGFLFMYYRQKLFRPASRKLEKSLFYIQSSLSLWVQGSQTFMIPMLPNFAWHSSFISFNMPDYVSDYSYWDNTDRPNDITQGRWGTRGRKWRTLFDAPMLTFDLVSVDDYVVMNKLEKVFVNLKVK